MNWIGDFPEDFTTVAVYFTTHDGNGAPVAPLSAFETADVAIYKNGSATQKATVNGLTMTSPFDSVVGLHCLLIDTSNDTGDAAFWVTGCTYTVVLNPDTETVNSQTVVKVLATFGICLAPALRPTTAGRTAAIDASGQVTVGALASGAITATSIAADAITDAKVASDVTIASVTGAVGSVTGAVGSVTGAVGSVTGAVGSVTGNVGGNVTGSVGSVASGGISASSFAAGAIDAAAIATDAIGSAELAASAVTEIQSGLTSLDAAGIRSAIGLASANLDTQLGDLPTANENADALLDRTAGVETSRTVRQSMRLMLAVLCGKASGLATTTAVFRDTNDGTNRVSATVDSSGNRTAVTLDAS